MWADGVGRWVDVMDRAVECRTVSENHTASSELPFFIKVFMLDNNMFLCCFLSHPLTFFGLTEVWDNIHSLKVKTFFYMCIGNVKMYILKECIEVSENTTD